MEQEFLIEKISELYDPKDKEKLKNDLSNLPSLSNDLIKNLQKLAIHAEVVKVGDVTRSLNSEIVKVGNVTRLIQEGRESRGNIKKGKSIRTSERMGNIKKGKSIRTSERIGNIKKGKSIRTSEKKMRRKSLD